MSETKLPVSVVTFLTEGKKLFDPIASGLSILQFKLAGAMKIVGVKEIDLASRVDEIAVAIEMEINDKKLSMVDQQFLQCLVVTSDHFAEMQENVKHKFGFAVKGGKTESFESLFFLEDVDDAGLKNADVMKPLFKALGLGETTTEDVDLTKLNLELVGVMVNKRRDDDVQLFDHEFPRSKAGSYPQYRALREEFEKNSSDPYYTIGTYIEDYEQKNGHKPNINMIVNVARNWTFTPIFVDKSGNLIK